MLWLIRLPVPVNWVGLCFWEIVDLLLEALGMFETGSVRPDGRVGAGWALCHSYCDYGSQYFGDGRWTHAYVFRMAQTVLPHTENLETQKLATNTIQQLQFSLLSPYMYIFWKLFQKKSLSLKVPTFTHLYNNIYILPLTGTPEQQLFTVWGGVLNCTSNRQCGAITDCPLPEWTYFEPTVAARQTHLCSSQPHYGLHPTMFSGKDSLFYLSSEYYKLHIRRDGRLSWLKRYKCK